MLAFMNARIYMYACMLHSFLYMYEWGRSVFSEGSPWLCGCVAQTQAQTTIHIKTKARNSMFVKDDMRLALTNIQPQRLVAQMQAQPSH